MDRNYVLSLERYTQGTRIRLQISFSALIARGGEETRNRMFFAASLLGYGRCFDDTILLYILPSRVARQNANIARSGVMLV